MNTAQPEPRELVDARARLSYLKEVSIGREGPELTPFLQEQFLTEKLIADLTARFAEAESARVKDEERQFANSKPPWAFP